MDKIYNSIANAIDKFFSARFLITVGIGLTYCHLVWHGVHFYLKSLVNDPSRMEAFAQGLITGFSGLAMFVIKAYFDRSDRKDPPEAPKAPVNAPASPAAPLAVAMVALSLLGLSGCVRSSLEATGVDVHDPTHGVQVVANSVNAQLNTGA